VTMLKVTQKRSVIGRPQDQRATIRGLGLRRVGHTVELENTPAVRGMVKKVIHLVTVEEPGA
jgi:large subunit ribosomal protein L30